MSSITRSLLVLVPFLATLCLAQSGTTLDDADSSITYAGQWHHDAAGSDYLHAGTQSVHGMSTVSLVLIPAFPL